MELDKKADFTRLTTKFLFINCSDGENDINKVELNAILNELNSFDYSGANFVDQNAAIRLLESFIFIPSCEDTLIVKTCWLISALINKQKIQLSASQLSKIIDWQLKCLNFNFRSTVCDILASMQSLFKHHRLYCKDYWDVLLSPDGLFVKFLNKFNNKATTEKYDNNSSEEIIISTICCIESLLNIPEDENNKLADVISAPLAVIGSKVLDIFYTSNILISTSIHHINTIKTSLNVLLRISSMNPEWCQKNIGELLGVAKAYMLFGLPDVQLVKPQRVPISQQSIQEPTIHEQTNKGGKVAKSRKRRTNNKNKKIENKPKGDQSEDNSASTSNAKLKVDVDNSFVLPFSKTSDSDYSETETNRSLNERHKQAKLRITAISLIGFIAKNTEKRILYGYWHSLFPSDPLSANTSALLNCVLRDSNPRCRIAALQTATVMIYGSRPFLLQSESRMAPTSYLPFSISLGYMIYEIYKALTVALSNENSLPVIIQILKCLSVLIQATPFHRLESGFTTEFVKYVKRFIYHRDPSIQVGALTVMEFLISTPEITSEISQIVEIPKVNFVTKQLNQNRLNDSGVEEIIDAGEYDEEIIDSDYEDDNKIGGKNENAADTVNFNMSWLLQKALENLGVIVKDRQPKTSPSTTPVRIESLQVLCAMTSHFLLLKDHLQFISATLKITLIDVNADVRLYTAKCLDNLGHSINTFLLENDSVKTEDIGACNQFWASILPSVIEKIQDVTETAAIKSILCDFMSNIGVHIFERLPHAGQIQLISLLSGASCNEEHTVRAAAVRALAVFVLYPSLRENLCFVENTAESILELIQDARIFVRIKASWSMGNISDALITNCLSNHLDRISDDLLKRMLEAAIVSASDNDKVRSNAVRTLGNLLRLISGNHIQSETWRSLILKAIEKLASCMSCGGNVKVKWNSCYAVGNFMKNEILFFSHKDFNWKSLVFPSLCNIIINSTNFKVRINGASAFTNIQSRENIGTYFKIIWSSLITAIEQADNLSDFTEYKHRDNLHEQLCISMSHMIQLAANDDFGVMQNELIPKLETVRETWTRVINRVLPENTAPLFSSCYKLQELLKRSELTNEQKNSIQFLCTCFIQPILL